MSYRTWTYRALFVIPLLLGVLVMLGGASGTGLLADGRHHVVGPSHSGPIAVTPDDRFVWVANPDDDSVTLIDVGGDANRVVDRIRVGDEPQNVVISPDGRHVYVSNTRSGTVTVIRTHGSDADVVRTIRVGTEPYGMALTPDGKKLYVANARSNDVSVINTKNLRVADTIDDVGLEPRGVAITSGEDGDDDDAKVYVTQFLGVDRPGVLIGRDDYKEGRVTVISAEHDKVIGQVVLNPIASGFKSNGSVLDHVAPTDPATFTFPTQAFPNQLNSIVIKGNRAYVPNTGASPDGPVRFNVNVQALLSVIDIRSDQEGQAGGAPQTINMNRGINFEPGAPNRTFLAVPWAIEFKHRSNQGYAVLAGSNILVEVDLDADGTPTIHAPTSATDPGAIVRIPVGQNPRGIAINSRDDRAYVMNEVSRDVSVVDLGSKSVVATIATSDLPAPGSEAATLLVGKAIFNSSTGVNLPRLGPAGVIGRRLSSEGWSACASCHPFGLTDGVVWIFASGPRRTLPLNGSFNPHDPQDAKILNHSAIFDELQDFELNIRNVSGGLGLITLADGTTPDPNVKPFVPLANAGRSPALDAMTMFVAHGVRTPISPLSSRHHQGRKGHEVREGRELFEDANCASCHGGGGWASSRRNFSPPPAATRIDADGQLPEFLKPVGTFNPAQANELRANGKPALGAGGFNPPTLLGDFAMGPFLHDGSAITLDDVMALVPHRSAGTGGVDKLASAKDRRALISFLQSIDASTEPFDLGSPGPVPERATLALSETVGELSLAVVGANPAPVAARLAYAQPRAGRVELALFDVSGRRVAKLVDETRPAGRYQVDWDGRQEDGAIARGGVYFARLRTVAGQRVTRLVLAR